MKHEITKDMMFEQQRKTIKRLLEEAEAKDKRIAELEAMADRISLELVERDTRIAELEAITSSDVYLTATNSKVLGDK